MSKIYDYIVIGSGFGGSVSTMRLAEKGYTVLCIEQGRRYNPEDFPRTNWKLSKYLWWPPMGMYGIQKLSFYSKASILTGTGVGGGSLVYANTLFHPEEKFFRTGSWSILKNWREELEPYYDVAGFMMGRTKLDRVNTEDYALKKVAEKMGRADSFENVYVGVNLSDSGEPEDPYFSGLGPTRNRCVDCAACMTGCRENAKNTLDKNYLYFAEMFGAEILPETRVDKIEFDGKTYSIYTRNTRRTGKKNIFKAEKLILSAGTLGTLRLLFRQKYTYKSLPLLSDKLGENLLTNSETLCAVSSSAAKLNNGVAISSVFHPDDHTHVEIVKFADGSNSLKWFFSLATDGGIGSFARTLKLVGKILLNPVKIYKTLLRRNWSTNLIIFLVMQDLENSMKMKWARGLFGRKMKIINKGKDRVPAYIPIGQEVMKKYAEEVKGIPQNIILEILFNRPTTAHILGGCLMGINDKDSLVNDKLEVHNYHGMYIIDGSIIQANPGVNPSYSILAMAEYAMAAIPVKDSNKKTLKELIADKNENSNYEY